MNSTLRRKVQTEPCGYPRCHNQVDVESRYVVWSRHSGAPLCGDHSAGGIEARAAEIAHDARRRPLGYGRTGSRGRSGMPTMGDLLERGRELASDHYLDECERRKAAFRWSMSRDEWREMVALGAATEEEARAYGVDLEERIDSDRGWETRSDGGRDNEPSLCPSGLWQVDFGDGRVGFYSLYEEAEARARGASRDEARRIADEAWAARS